MNWNSYYWVEKDRLLAGNFPWSDNPEQAEHKLIRLKELGITLNISLLEMDEIEELHGNNLCYVDAMKSAGIKVVHHPIPDFSIPSIDQMKDILKDIKICLDKNEKIYLHCRGGIGRTGTVVGCYLIQNGFANASNVIEKIHTLKSGSGLHMYESPETWDQINFIFDWAKK